MASTKSATTAVKEKKPKCAPAHPPYVEMIKEAIVALKERTGSSQIAIAKFIEGKEKHLPANFKKLLSVQLKKLVANGKLVKVKNSFKLAPSLSVKSKTAAEKPAAEPKKKKETVVKPKKKKETVAEKKKPAAPKKAAHAAPKTKGKKDVVASPVKKVAKKVKSLKVVKSPMKKAAPVSKKVKSIKSPKKKKPTAAAAKK